MRERALEGGPTYFFDGPIPPSIRVFFNELFFTSGGQSVGVLSLYATVVLA